MYNAICPFLFFMSLLLMVWGGFWLVIIVCLRVANIIRYQGCRVWVFATLRGTLFQLVVSPFNWIDEAMDYLGEKVGQVLNTEASHGRIVEDQADLIKEEITIDRLTKKYLWWTPKSPIDGTTNRGIRDQECLPGQHFHMMQETTSIWECVRPRIVLMCQCRLCLPKKNVSHMCMELVGCDHGDGSKDKLGEG